MRARLCSFVALGICAIALSGCENGFCDHTENPAIQFLGSILGCTQEDIAEESPPEARFTVTPAQPHVGEPVTFDAGPSFEGGGTTNAIVGLVGYEWDTNGDNLPDLGGFKSVTDTTTENPFREVTTTYFAPGRVLVGLRVTNASGDTDTVQIPVDVLPPGAPGGGPSTPTSTATPTPSGSSSSAPTSTVVAARLRAGPNPVPPGRAVTLDATGSIGGDGATITKYEWDVDGKPDFELDSGSSGTIVEYFPAGDANRQQVVRARVTDSSGAVSPPDAVSLTVCASSGCSSPGRAHAAAARERTSLTVFGRLLGGLHGSRVVGRASAKFAISGAIPSAGDDPKVPTIVRTLLNGRWTVAPVGVAHGRIHGRAFVKAGRTRACASVTMGPGKKGGLIPGTLRLLGGTGAAGRARISVRFLSTAEGKGLRVLGTLQATTGAKARKLPRACLPASGR